MVAVRRVVSRVLRLVYALRWQGRQWVCRGTSFKVGFPPQGYPQCTQAPPTGQGVKHFLARKPVLYDHKGYRGSRRTFSPCLGRRVMEGSNLGASSTCSR